MHKPSSAFYAREQAGNSTLWAAWDAIRYNPSFDSECLLYAQERTEALQLRPYLSKITSTEARYVPMRGALSAYYSRLATTGEKGLTLSDVHQASLLGCDLGSRNRVTGLINSLQSVGIVKVETSAFDRRERILRITEIGDMVLERLRASSVNRVASMLGIDIAAPGTPEHYADLARYYGRGFELANTEYRITSIFPEYASFFNRTFGLELLNLLFIAASKSGAPRPGNFSFSYSRMSERFDISRAQMRQLVVHCQELGLINVHGLGGRETEITPKFIELYQDLVATMFSLTAISLMTAEQEQNFSATQQSMVRQLA